MKRRKNLGRIARIAAAAPCFAAVVGSVLFPNLLRGNFQTQAGSDLLALTAEFSLGAAAALAGVLLVTLIVGRLYCSVLCPLGILQDLLGWLRFRKYRNTPWKRKVRGPVFWLVAGAAACGFLLVRAAWEEANRRRLVPAGEDWPPLPSREFTSNDNPATPPAGESFGDVNE